MVASQDHVDPDGTMPCSRMHFRDMQEPRLESYDMNRYMHEDSLDVCAFRNELDGAVP